MTVLFFSLIQIIRINLLVGAKIITLITCMYYITKYSEYQVQLGWFRILLPTRLIYYIDSTYGMTGTIVLLIPSTIVLLSFLMDNVGLKLLSGFLGVFGVMYSVIRGFYKNVLGEVSDLGLFMIRHIATLEKKEWFKFEVSRYSKEVSGDIQQKYEYIQKYFTDQDFVTYDYKLNTLDTLVEVQTYAKEVVNTLLIQFYNLPKATHWYHHVGHFTYDIISDPKFIKGCIIIGGGIVLSIWIYGLFYNPDIKGIVTENTEISKAAADVATQGSILVEKIVDNSKMQQEIMADISIMFKPIVSTIAVNSELISNAQKDIIDITKAVDLISMRTAGLITEGTELSTLVKKINEIVLKLAEHCNIEYALENS